jgi:hypothetical protein
MALQIQVLLDGPKPDWLGNPAIGAIALAGLLRMRGRWVVPAIMASKWFWFFVIIYQ